MVLTLPFASGHNMDFPKEKLSVLTALHILGRTQCQDEFRNLSGKTQNLKSPETPKERYRQVTILDLDDI